jgi:hypothetical protein
MESTTEGPVFGDERDQEPPSEQHQKYSVPKANEYWLKRIKRDGVRLTVEIDISYEQFRALLMHGIGGTFDDDETYHYWEIANRRLLPPDCGSFSGIGFDVGEIVREKLEKIVEEHKLHKVLVGDSENH